MRSDASNGERCVIKTPQPILRHDKHGQGHRYGQIAHKIIMMNRHQPAADAFDKHMFNSILKRAKRSQNVFDVDVRPFCQAAHNRRSRGLQPDWINFVDPQAFAPGGEQKLRVATISTTDRFHSGTARARCTQQTQELNRRVRFAHAGICPGEEEAHATCFARSDVALFALIVCIIERKIFAPSALPSRASDARSG